jgi:hypothetical protein
MEKSFSPLNDLIAKRLIQVGNIPKREASDLSKRASKKKTVDERKEAEEAELQNAVELSLERTLQNALAEPDFVRMEKNIAGFGFFTPSSKRIKNVPKIIRFTQTVDGSRVEAQVKISGNVEYGMPITADQDKYLAFQKIIERCKREKGTVENPVTFTTAELLALLGTSKNGNRYREVEEWLKVMNATFIESEGAIWLNGKKRFASDSFVIFQRVRRAGQELEDGSIADRNYVWLSDWYLENLNAHYLLPIEFETYKLLKNNISKALIPLLQVWLYASREVGSFEKRYSELCQILNIREYQHRSKIKEKLAPSLDELAAQGYLKTWEIEKTADEKDFKIIFRHGYKFYADRAALKQLSGRKRKGGENAATEPPKTENRTELPKRKKEAVEPPNFASGEVSTEEPDTILSGNLPTAMTGEHLELIQTLHVGYQIAYEKALELVTQHFAETAKQVAAYPFREINPKNKAGFLIQAIEQKYSLPDGYYAHLREAEATAVSAHRQAEIDRCQLCGDNGWRNVKSEKDTFYGLMHQCTHDPEIESQYEEHKL